MKICLPPSLPHVEKIKLGAFARIVNASSTKITLPSSFNTNDQKSEIFKESNWDQIDFILV